MESHVRITKCDLSTVDRIVPLFDDYRVAFGQQSDAAHSRRFLSDRLSRSESVIFLAEENITDRAVGFTQLYPSFASLAAKPILVLNDLYIVDNYRRRGIATQLIHHVHEYGRLSGALRVTLITEHTNTAAQSLYESLGYKLDTAYRRYIFAL